MDYIIQTNS